ncbi:MAG: hypothetical protein WC488_03460 [Candidatus Micrarchaeia archaeon]
MLQKRHTTSELTSIPKDCGGTLNNPRTDKSVPKPVGTYSVLSEPIRLLKHTHGASDRGGTHFGVILRALQLTNPDAYGNAFVSGRYGLRMDTIFSRVSAILEKQANLQKLTAQEKTEYACFLNALVLLASIEGGQTLATIIAGLKNPEHARTVRDVLERGRIPVPPMEQE